MILNLLTRKIYFLSAFCSQLVPAEPLQSIHRLTRFFRLHHHLHYNGQLIRAAKFNNFSRLIARWPVLSEMFLSSFPVWLMMRHGKVPENTGAKKLLVRHFAWTVLSYITRPGGSSSRQNLDSYLIRSA